MAKDLEREVKRLVEEPIDAPYSTGGFVWLRR